MMKLEILRYINEATQPFETKFMKAEINEAGILRELGSQIAELSVWALLKQIETGEQFTEVISFYLSYIGGAQALLKRTIIQKETPYLELEKRIALSDPKVALGEFEEYRPALKRYTEALEKLYPRVKEFEALYAKACEGKSCFKIQKGV